MRWWCSASGAAWTWDPRPYVGAWMVAALLLAALWRSGAFRRTRPTARRAAAAIAPVVILLATDWPLAALGAGYMVTAQMIRQVLIVLVASPLLLFGAPPSWGAWIGRSETRRRVLRRLSHPLLALVVADGILIILNTPPVVDTMIGTQVGSFAVDGIWLVAGLILWYPVQAPEGLTTRLSGLAQTVYLIAVSVAPLPIAFFMTWSRFPLFSTFELAPRVFADFDAQTDQEVAAAVLQVLGGLIIWVQIIGRFVSMPEAINNRSPRLVSSSEGARVD